MAQYSRGTPSLVIQQRINALLKLEEERENAKLKFQNHQQLVKRWFDGHYVGSEDFEVGDLLLKWNKINEIKGKHMKFQQLWLGPFQMVEKIGKRTYRLRTLHGQLEKLPINGQILK